MGVRHQIYIIANVLGRYRIVAAYHHQSIGPPQVVNLAWNLLQLVKKHAGPLVKELRCLQQGRYNKNVAAYPCPFLLSLLSQCVEDCYSFFNMFPLSVINNDPWKQGDGFTVIDVTDPFSPAYCFWGWDADYGFVPGDPIDPEGYALWYCVDVPGEERKWEYLEKEEQDAILEIQSEPFISKRQTLDEAWSNWSYTLEELEEEVLSRDAREFTKALQVVIKAGSTDDAQQMADSLPSTSGVVEGLRRALRGKRLPKCCDPVIVLKVVRAVLQDNSFKISSLDISGNLDIAIGTLSEIFKLRGASELKRLFVFGCPKLEDLKRADIPDRIGAVEGTEVFNSYFPAELPERSPWMITPSSGKPRPRV
ncbi:hypothetical protein FRC01_003441 [Tulasnella sp. 417]|nr:hypothetical protein FRC01_003441 [Tulasnella sp. 417]